MQREIANLAAHCALQGFRYMAFPPPAFDPPQPFEAPPPLEAAPDPVPVIPPAETPTTVLAAVAATPMAGVVARRHARRIALLDDVTDPRPARRAAAPNLPRAIGAPVARAERAPSPARAERAPSPARAERAPSPARAERATRYALLRDLSDDPR